MKKIFEQKIFFDYDQNMYQIKKSTTVVNSSIKTCAYAQRKNPCNVMACNFKIEKKLKTSINIGEMNSSPLYIYIYKCIYTLYKIWHVGAESPHVNECECMLRTFYHCIYIAVSFSVYILFFSRKCTQTYTMAIMYYTIYRTHAFFLRPPFFFLAFFILPPYALLVVVVLGL